jgi:GNAT superfamily N-acetyltransferase
MPPEPTIVPANHASREDLQAVFGTRGAAAICQCQRYKLKPKEAFSKFPAEERAHRLRVQTECGHPRSKTTSGLVAYLDGEPVGWCAVEPRTAYEGLLRHYKVPWEGRNENRDDASVWAVTCVLVRAGFRGRRIGHALVDAAVGFARERGARALEGYPLVTEPGKKVIWDEIHVGTRSMFRAAGFDQVHHPTKRRVVMRLDFSPDGKRTR